jgi:hypothetical protein
MLKTPSSFEEVPSLEPFTRIEAKETGAPFSSRTLPVIVLFWVKPNELTNKKHQHKMWGNILFINNDFVS